MNNSASFNSSVDKRIAALVPTVDPFLRTEFQKALRTLRDAENIPATIVSVSRLLEGERGLLGRIAASQKTPQRLKGMALADQIDVLQKAGIIPPEIASDLHWIRVRANRARHNIECITLAIFDAETALSLALNALQWFCCEYLEAASMTTIYSLDATQPITLHDHFERLCQERPIEETRERYICGEKVVGLRPAGAQNNFLDRHDVTAQFRDWLSDHDVKLICICGRSGMGKTALLAHICSQVEENDLRLPRAQSQAGADGLIYVDCTQTNGDYFGRLFEAFGRLLGSPRQMELRYIFEDPSLDVETKTRVLLSKLREGCYLLIFENVEEWLSLDQGVMDAAMNRFINICLTTSHGLRVLMTSRIRVTVNTQALRFMRTLTIDEGLPEQEAMSLLRELDRTGELGLSDAPDAILHAAVRRVAGIPRALEGIAGLLVSTPALSLDQLLADTDLVSSHIVEGLLAEHLRRLSVDQRRVLDALSIYTGPVAVSALEFTLSHVLTVEQIRRNLGDLVSSHLVTGRRGRDIYTLHPLDRQYIYDHVSVSGSGLDRHTCHVRVSEYYLALAREWIQAVRTPREADSLDAFDENVDSVRLAMDWSWKNLEYCLCGEIAIVLVQFLQRRGRHTEAVARVETGLEACRQIPETRSELQASLMLERAGLYLDRFQWDEGTRYAQEVWHRCRIVEDAPRQAAALNLLGLAARGRKDSATAIEFFERALTKFHELNDTIGVSIALNNLGMTEDEGGYTERAVGHLAEALALRRHFEDRRGIAESLANVGALAFDQGRIEKAYQSYAEALGIETELGNAYGVARLLFNLGEVAERRNQPEAVWKLATAATHLFSLVGSPHEQSAAELLGRTAITGKPPTPVKLIDSVEEELRRCALFPLVAWAFSDPESTRPISPGLPVAPKEPLI